MKSGKLYYRINTSAQAVRNGRRYRKRKYRDVPLVAQTLAGAIEEIKARNLFELNAEVQKRKLACRDIHVLEWLTGLITPPSRLSRKFRVLLEHYAPSAVAG